ncbi:MAG: ABC transporter ATP-binding protein [Lachnospiraceae bacterium]|nr:ABC transporter ATP-binding protein [Lachnospiraceae bacterium]
MLCKQFERIVPDTGAGEAPEVEDDINKPDINKTEAGKETEKLLRKKTKAKKNRKESFYAVKDVSFRVNDGEILGLLGKNGAGKTTLLRMLASVMEPTAGGVYIKTADGRHLNDSVSLKKEIGYLSGNTRLYHRISTREMLYMLGEIYELDRDVTEKRIDEICRILDMSSFIDNRIERLSTGQTQRASIARCLIHDPSIYIFDEPTLGLDIVSADAIVDFMKGQKEKGKTVLYSTHYLEEAQFLCDRILMINEGRIVAEGTPAELMERTGTGNLREAFHKILE